MAAALPGRQRLMLSGSFELERENRRVRRADDMYSTAQNAPKIRVPRPERPVQVVDGAWKRSFGRDDGVHHGVPVTTEVPGDFG